MAKKRKAPKSNARRNNRLHRAEPARTAPNRSARDHVRRNARSRNDSVRAGRSKQPPESIADTVQQTIAGVVDLGYSVIERQILEGQRAAERLRAGLATSAEFNTDVNNLVEGLVATTRDVGATWLDLLSIVLRSVGPQAPCAGAPRDFAPPGQTGTRAGTTTRTSTSGSATTISSITPADPTSPRVPPVIEVRGIRVRRVTLHLQPPSVQFVPFVRSLVASDPQAAALTGVRFELSADRTHSVLVVDVPPNQPAGTYTGVIVDSSSNEPGGMVSVVVGS
jgi:hypothetical protein